MSPKFLLTTTLLLSFPAYADIFMLPQTQDILYESAYPLNEYLIPTADKTCVFHYLSDTKPANDSLIQIQNAQYPDSCLEKGAARVHITNAQGAVLETFDGYFLNGFFIADLPLNSRALKRTSDEENTQYLDFLIDEDKELNIRYIGTMHASLTQTGYGAFDACAPFEITLQTPNKSLFENKDTLQNLSTVIKSYATTLCPSGQVIEMNATDSPSLTAEGIFFTQRWVRNPPNGEWTLDDENSMHPSFSSPVQDSPAPAFPDVISAHQLLKAAEQTATPVWGQFIVHVSDKTSPKVVFADTPFIMKSLQNKSDLTQGWYRIWGSVEVMNDFERKRSGISLNEQAALLVIEKAERCANPSCRD